MQQAEPTKSKKISEATKRVLSIREYIFVNKVLNSVILLSLSTLLVFVKEFVNF